MTKEEKIFQELDESYERLDDCLKNATKAIYKTKEIIKSKKDDKDKKAC